MYSTGLVCRVAGVAVVALGLLGYSGHRHTVSAADTMSGNVAVPGDSPVGINGQLRVCKTKKLCNQYGNPIQLRGISSHGLQWYSQCINGRSLNALANDWGSDVIRLSMYVQENGYETDPAGYTKLINKLIKKATKRGLYVIVDWHILTPGDPNVNLELARDFFKTIAKRHADKTNILYEVANEPNGVSWDSLRGYHEAIVPVIRDKDPEAVVLLGTRGWSSLGVSEGADESEVLDAPVDAKNIMYTFHFYAASHQATYRKALKRAARKVPMMVTEFGLQSFTGDGENDFAESRRYVRMMENKKISWVYWNFSDDWRTGPVLVEGTCPDGKFSGTGSLKPSGEWIRDQMRTADAFPTD